MKHSELRVGMKVKANKKSNDKYIITNEKNNCEGVVENILDTFFTLRITNSKVKSQIGGTQPAQADCFDIVEDMPSTLKASNVVKKIQQMESELEKLKLEVTKETNPENLELRTFSGKVKHLSWRCDLEVLKVFDKLCAMYPHYTKQDILSTVLMEALEKYL